MENRLTLSQLQAVVTNAIRLAPSTQNVWVQAELSDLRGGGGHWYMELVEKDAAGNTRAKLRAMIWNGTQQILRRKFFDATGRDISTGLKVLVRGSVNHHPIYGLSFTINDIDPSYTLGDMERIRREILERLAREGIAGHNKSLPFPLSPQRIAIVSASGAAGYGDFMNQIENNPDGFAIYTVLFEALMQGERTPASVMAALDMIEHARTHFDAVVIIRGGGATTDLNGFDNYDLARRVATFLLPVIVGIGHERDRTVLDELACVRCKTPTAVAAFIIDSLRNAYALATDHVRRIADFASASLRGENIRLANLAQAIPVQARNIIVNRRLRLNSLAQAIPSLVGNRVNTARLRLMDNSSRIARAAQGILSARQAQLGQLSLQLCNRAENSLQRERLRLDHLGHALQLLSPANTLKRGYTITRIDGHAVTSVAQLSEGTRIETTFADGSALSSITNLASQQLNNSKT